LATTIRFIGAADNVLRVSEDADSVAQALDSGAPLNAADGSGPVFVNGSAVAFWYEHEPMRPREDSGIASSMSPF